MKIFIYTHSPHCHLYSYDPQTVFPASIYPIYLGMKTHFFILDLIFLLGPSLDGFVHSRVGVFALETLGRIDR